MKTKWNFSALILMTVCFGSCLLGCVGDTPNPDYIPSLPQLWVDVPANTHSITWTNLPRCPTPIPCQKESTFGGFDSYSNGTIRGTCQLVGFYKNQHIEWTYPDNAQNAQCPLKGVSYIGVINQTSDKIGAYSPKLKQLLILEKH